MINFRFHLVSLIAVFLALALGVVVGSTVIDRAIVDGLENQIDRVERNAEEQRRTNNELGQRLERLQVFEEQVASFAIEDRLPEVPVVILAVRGVDEDAVVSLVGAIRRAGAISPAVMWLEPSWALVDPEPREALRELLDRPGADGELLRRSAVSAIAQRIRAGGSGPGAVVDPSGATPPVAEENPGGGADDEAPSGAGSGPSDTAPPEDEETTTTTAAPVLDGGDLFEALAAAGLLEIDTAGGPEFDLETYPGAGARVVAISGTDARVSAEALFVPLVAALAQEPLLTLAGEISPQDDPAQTAADVVGLIRGDDDLGERVSTVDAAGRVVGRLASVLALEELGRGQVGHYGLGPGASRQLPEPAQA